MNESSLLNKSEGYLGRFIIIFCVCVIFPYGLHLSNIDFPIPWNGSFVAAFFWMVRGFQEKEALAVACCASPHQESP